MKKILYNYFASLFSKIKSHSFIKPPVKTYINQTNTGELNNTLHLDEKVILENLLSFRELKVGEVMIPRTDIIGIEYFSSLEECKEKFISSGHTRMPVYRSNLDDIVGFAHVKDFIPYIDGKREFTLDKIIRKVTYSPRSSKCINLLADMQQNTTHLAVVLDEYGGTEGIVVIENLVERIVGDIRDEHDKDMHISIQNIAMNTYIIDARAAILDVEEELDIILSEEDGDYETFGGFILSYLDKIPEKGEKIYHPVGIELEILDAEPRKIKSIKVIKVTSEQK